MNDDTFPEGIFTVPLPAPTFDTAAYLDRVRRLTESFGIPRNIYMGTDNNRFFNTPPRKYAADEMAFLRAVVATPKDPLPRSQFADWLDEKGLVKEAAGQRWLVKHGKYPMPKSSSTGGWYRDKFLIPSRIAIEHKLPTLFWGINHGSTPPASEYFNLRDPLECECWFLRVACLRVEWDADGEPRDPFALRVGDPVCTDPTTGNVRLAGPDDVVYGTVVNLSYGIQNIMPYARIRPAVRNRGELDVVCPLPGGRLP